jgi:hypothetical protein
MSVPVWENIHQNVILRRAHAAPVVWLAREHLRLLNLQTRVKNAILLVSLVTYCHVRETNYWAPQAEAELELPAAVVVWAAARPAAAKAMAREKRILM